ncbi:MAG: hypothetical protein G5663_04155 [Serratia symbiotica]|nr:hypothetical protein [Serratia symbiotica]
MAVDTEIHEVICFDFSLSNITDTEAFPDLIRQDGTIKLWKSMTGYHRRSIAERAMYREKKLFGGHLSLRDDDARRYAIKCTCCLKYPHSGDILFQI